MLRRGTLVKIVSERQSTWNCHGHMDCFKGAWAIIAESNERAGYYRLNTLTGANDQLVQSAAITHWKWYLTDFEIYENHCVNCGDLLKKEVGSPFCEACEHPLTFKNISVTERIKNIAATSLILPEEIKAKIIEKTKVENIKTCADCGNIIEGTNYYTRTDGKHICDICRENYYYCENCFSLFPRGEEIMGATGRLFCCEDCQIKADPYNFKKELAYNAKPPVHFLGSKDKDDLFLGVEVEVDGDYENKDDCIYNIFTADAEEVYCKHDGSLEGGFEFVTHPATLDYHKNVLKYDELIAICNDWGFSGEGYETTGLHIHASKNFFGGEKEGNINALKLEILFERFWNEFLTLAGRSETKAERWAKKRVYIDIYKSEEIRQLSDSLVRDMVRDRYTAINITNKNTIEFRLFRGTTKKGRIFAMLELVDYLCRFVKNINIDTALLISWDDLFVNMLKGEHYPNLKEHFKKYELDKIEAIA